MSRIQQTGRLTELERKKGDKMKIKTIAKNATISITKLCESYNMARFDDYELKTIIKAQIQASCNIIKDCSILVRVFQSETEDYITRFTVEYYDNQEPRTFQYHMPVYSIEMKMAFSKDHEFIHGVAQIFR